MTAGSFAGTGPLLRFMLRRDRVRLPVWTAGTFVFVLYLTVGIPQVYGSDADLAAATVLFADPVGRLLTGPGHGFDAPTVAGFIANGYGLYLMLLAALMSILLVVRHTRAEEQTGRAELVLAGAVTRRARLIAAGATVLLANLAVGASIVVAMVLSGGHDPSGSLLLGASVTAVGLTFGGVSLLTVQIASTSRGAGGLAGVVVGVSFALRAVGDMAAPGGTWPSWLSPLGQAQQTAPFVLDRWWPLLPVLGLSVAMAFVGGVLAERRDLGSGFLPDRIGPADGARGLASPIGLERRLQRSTLIAWTLSLTVGGLLFGAFSDALSGTIDDLPEVFTELFGAADLLAGYHAYMAMFMGFLVSAYAVLAVQSRVTEELSGRLDPLVAIGVARSRWMLAGVTVTATASAVLMVAAGAATGVGTAVVTGDATHIPHLAVAHLVHVPAVWVVLGLAIGLHGLAPRSVAATWALVGYAIIVGTFGPLLDLPTSAFHVSPFSHPPQLPADELDAGALVVSSVLVAVAAGLVAIGVVGFRRRDLRGD